MKHIYYAHATSAFFCGSHLLQRNSPTVLMMILTYTIPINKKTCNQSCFNVGPPSTTLDQHSTSIMSKFMLADTLRRPTPSTSSGAALYYTPTQFSCNIYYPFSRATRQQGALIISFKPFTLGHEDHNNTWAITFLYSGSVHYLVQFYWPRKPWKSIHYLKQFY